MSIKITFKHLSRVIASAAVLHCSTAQAQFTAGNVTVLQAGDGVASLANTGNAVVLKEYSPSGTATYSVAVPTSGANALIVSGSATSEGVLSLSSNKQFLVFGGYAVALPNATALAASASSVISRGVGIVGANGGYTLSATSPSFYSGNNLRAAASDGAGNFWGAGGNDGTNYFGTASPSVNVQNVKANTRAIAIYNGQLYLSTQSAAGAQTNLGIYSVGNGTPTTTSQTITNVINTGSTSAPAQFCFNAAGTVCYVADQRTVTAMGGVQKWVYSAPNWTLAYTIGTGSANIGAFGVTADFSGSTPVIYATTGETTSNRLIAINDIGATATATTIATSGTNTAFRGVALSPGTAGPTGITENNHPDFNVNIFPNPASDKITIACSEQAQVQSYSITNAVGKLVMEGGAENNSQVSIGSLPAGLYFIHVAGQNFSLTKKLIKE